MAREGVTTFSSGSHSCATLQASRAELSSPDPAFPKVQTERISLWKASGLGEEIGQYWDPALSPSWHPVICKVSCKSLISWCLDLFLELLRCLQTNCYLPLVEQTLSLRCCCCCTRTHAVGAAWGTSTCSFSTWVPAAVLSSPAPLALSHSSTGKTNRARTPPPQLLSLCSPGCETAHLSGSIFHEMAYL